MSFQVLRPYIFLCVRIIMRMLTFTQECFVIAYFIENGRYHSQGGASNFRKFNWFALILSSVAFFVTGIICARTAWVCSHGACGVLPLRRLPWPLGYLLTIPFGWCQLVIIALAYQEFERELQESSCEDGPPLNESDEGLVGIGVSPSVEGSIVAPQRRASKPDSVQTVAAEQTNPDTHDAVRSAEQITANGEGSELSQSFLDHSDHSNTVILPELAAPATRLRERDRLTQRVGGSQRRNLFHCEIVDGALQGLTFGTVLAFQHWGLDYPPGRPIETSITTFMGMKTDYFLVIAGVISFLAAAYSITELDQRASDSVQSLLHGRWWYCCWHIIFRGCELMMRVWLHIVCMVLLYSAGVWLAWIPFLTSFVATSCIVLLNGGDHWHTLIGVILMLGISGVSVFSDIFYFVDHPQESRAARRISICLRWRNLIEIMVLPLCVVLCWYFDVVDVREKQLLCFYNNHSRSGFMCLVAIAVYFLSIAFKRRTKPSCNLYEACVTGKYEAVQRVLSAPSGPDINRWDADGFTPLMLAACYAHEDICLLLLYHDAMIEAPQVPTKRIGCCVKDGDVSRLHWDALHLCAWQGTEKHACIALHLICMAKSVENFPWQDARGDTPLHVAARHGNIDFIRRIKDSMPGEWLRTANHAGLMPKDVTTGEDLQVYLRGLEGPLSLPPDNLANAKIPLPPGEGNAWTPVETLRVRVLDKPQDVHGVCSFLIKCGSAALGELLQKPLQSVPEARTLSYYSNPTFRQEPRVHDDLERPEVPEAARLELDVLKPCNVHTGEGLNSEDGVEAWIRPPAAAKIGGGSYGMVYRACSTSDEATSSFAVKRIDKLKSLAGAAAVDRENEVSECVRQRPHPCLVQVYDVLDVPRWNLLFIVMEFCPGPSMYNGCDLYDAIRYFRTSPTGVAPAPFIQQWFAEVFLGLEHVHLKMRALLRDLKHTNVVLSLNAQAKLADFGLGRLDIYAPNLQYSFGCPPGTPGWAAPEIFQNKPYNYECDFFSLGVLLWVLLTGGYQNSGNPPHGNFGRNFYKHRTDHRLLQRCFNSPHDARPVPAGHARDLILRLTNENPKKRGTHDDMRQNQFLAGMKLPEASSSNGQVREWIRLRREELDTLASRGTDCS